MLPMSSLIKIGQLVQKLGPTRTWQILVWTDEHVHMQTHALILQYLSVLLVDKESRHKYAR
jgi:hypothetical protein